MNKQTDHPTIDLPGIDKVFILSVKSFSDRIAHVENELNKHQIPFEFVFNFDATDIKPGDLSIFNPSNMTIAHQSLVLKNIWIWKKMVKENIKRAMVFEDDIILTDNFREKLTQIIEDTKTLAPGYLIFLGGADTKLSPNFLQHPSPLVPRRITTAEGFIIDNTTAKKRCEWLLNNNISLPADGLMCKIDQDMGLPHYWPKQAIVEQASCTGKFKTTLDGSRSKHSLLYIKLRYQWHKFKNQSWKRWITKKNP